LFLKKETFFNWNRFYLLITAIASITLPFIKLESMKSIVPENFVIRLPEVIIGEVNPIENIPMEITSDTITQSSFTWNWDYLLFIGMVIASIILLYKIVKISMLIQNNPTRWKGNLLIVSLLKSNVAFSFFHYVFLGEYIKDEEKDAIIEHESVHVNHKHTLDLLFFELLRILFWFNPLVYLYQSRMTILHEYIADAKAMKQTSKKQYYQNLLSQVFDTQQISFTNTFYKQSLIKKRIVMLSKSKSHKIHLLKYALLLPAIVGMLIYTSCQEQLEIDNKVENLEQYSYTLRMPGKMNAEQKKIHQNYESFLRNNQDYVAWAEINYEKDEVSYSVHHKSENVPEGFMELQVGSEDGNSYKMFMNLKSDAVPKESSDTKFVPNDYVNAEEVPFSIIDEVPTLEECKTLTSNEDKRQCLSDYISGFVNRNFNTNLGNELNLTGRQRISVIFKIDKQGNITDVKTRAPHPKLKEEAIRVIKLLPQMSPGIHNGKAVVVPYSLPILFQVGE